MKIKCVKAECPVCNVTGSIQLFVNRNGEVRYARARHYSHISSLYAELQIFNISNPPLNSNKTEEYV